MFSFSLLSFAGIALAAVSVSDPSDFISPFVWAVDNAIVPNYNVPFISVQPEALPAAYTFEENSIKIDHKSFSTTLNDTRKSGYTSNLLWSSFYGFNAAINVANASTAQLDAQLDILNITVHNDAANIYFYGTDSTVYVSNSWLYSSGPVSHGVYASGNGAAYISNVAHFSGGHRSSSFSGDSPAGYIHVSDSVAHTKGIGSATFYARGEIYATNVVAISENAPTVFMDEAQKAYVTNCETTAGLLGGVAIFSSATRTSGVILSLNSSKITALPHTAPGHWFRNTIIDVSLYDTELVTASGILVVANFSQITQDFDYYASYADNPNLLPALVNFYVAESTLVGDLVAYNSSLISWSLASYSSWTGKAYPGFGEGYFDIHLDHMSTWTLTGTTRVQNVTDQDTTLGNVESRGFDVFYNASARLMGGWGARSWV